MVQTTDLPIINISSLHKNEGDFIHDNFAVSDTDSYLPEEIYEHPTIVNAIFFGICVRGIGKLKINLTEYDVNKNDVIVLIAGTIIQCDLSKVSDDFLIYFVTFSDDFIKEFDATNIYASLRNQPCVTMNDECTQTLIKRYFSLQEMLANDDYAFRKEILQYSLLANIYEFIGVR